MGPRRRRTDRRDHRLEELSEGAVHRRRFGAGQSARQLRPGRCDSLSQEIRSAAGDRTRWVAGVYYLNIDTDSDNGLKAPVNSIIFDLFGAPFDIGVKASSRPRRTAGSASSNST
jgi:hypothetical protein